MAGLVISFILVLVSSYFITSVYTPKQGKYRCSAFLILLCTMFAQVVLSFEILSLFKAINSTNVLIMNVIFFTASLIFWLKKGRPVYVPDLKNAFRKIWYGLKKDKFLMIMAFGLLFFIAVTVFLCIVSPIMSYDAMSYHLNRVAYWLSQGSLNHFAITDERNLVMPINSEILYFWVLVFLKNDYGLGFFSFFGYIACAYSVYNILGYFNFSECRKLWSVLILSSFASVIVEASSSETDVFIAGLILASIYLFLVSLKEKKLSLIFFSSLFYALATGTKSPAVIAFPGVFCLLCYFAYGKYKKESYKPLLTFFGFLFFNFVIFSSYNYILNFIDYHNFLGSESSRILHGFRGGIKAFVANFIRYIFMLFDFSGFRYSDYVGEHILNAREAVFHFLNIPPDICVEISDDNVINNGLSAVKMGAGILGFLLFLPSVVVSLLIKGWKILCRKNSEKISVMFIFALIFFINIACLSFSIAYFVFSIRFVTTMILISSPVLAMSYTRKNYLLKILILFFVMSYFLVMSRYVVSRNLHDTIKVLKQENTLSDARERIRCAVNKGYLGRNSFCQIKDFIWYNMPKGSRIGIIPNHNARLYVVKMLETKGYKTDIILPEKISSYDLSKYDFIIKTDEVSTSFLIQGNTKEILKKIKFDSKGEQVEQYMANTNCAYYNHNTLKALKADDKNPLIYAVVCYISDEYLSLKNFDKLVSINYKGDTPQEDNFVTIYYNKNLKSKIDTGF